MSEPSDHFNGQDSHAVAHTQSASRSSSPSKASHSHTYRNPSTSSSTSRQPQAQTKPSVHVQAQSSDGGIPPALASTLEHIIGQLDILTQVSGMCVNLSWQTACSALWLCRPHALLRTKSFPNFSTVKQAPLHYTDATTAHRCLCLSVLSLTFVVALTTMQTLMSAILRKLHVIFSKSCSVVFEIEFYYCGHHNWNFRWGKKKSL